jgi:BNR repeat-like domain
LLRGYFSLRQSSKNKLNNKMKASMIITIIILTSLMAYTNFEKTTRGQETTPSLEGSPEGTFKPSNKTEMIAAQTLNETESSNYTQYFSPTDNSSLLINKPEQVSNNSTITTQGQPNSMLSKNPDLNSLSGQNIFHAPITLDDVIVNDSNLSTQITGQSEFSPVLSTASVDYLAFNVLIDLNGAGVARFLRESAVHDVSNDGAITMQIFNQTTKTWTAMATVYNSSIDDRNFGVGIIDTKVYLFFTKINATSRNAVFGYIKSTDLTCNSWSKFNVLSYTHYLSAYGKMVQINSSTYLMPAYGFNGVNNYTLQIWRSNDSGNTWSWYSNIYSGLTPYTEFDLTTIGRGYIIATIRENLDDRLYQSISLDAGFSWSNITLTNLGFGGPTAYVNAGLYDSASGNFVLVGWDSAVGNLEISITPALTVLDNSLSYAQPKILDSKGLTEATYPNIVKLTNGNYFIGYSKVLQRETIIEPWQIVYSTQTSQP